MLCQQSSAFGVKSRHSIKLSGTRRGRQAMSASQQAVQVSRRTLLEMTVALPLLHQQLQPVLAQGAPEGTTILAGQTASPVSTSSPPPPPSIHWDDVDFELTVPGQYQFVEIPELPRRSETGPAPPTNPVKVRFDAPDGQSVVSVVVKPAQSIKPTFFQVRDITQYGSPQETAQLLLPEGSVVVGFSIVTVNLPPKFNSLGGEVEVPPKTYYRYDFTTPSGATVAMSAAAQRGKVYVCASTIPSSRWGESKAALQQVADSFRLKDAISIM